MFRFTLSLLTIKWRNNIVYKGFIGQLQRHISFIEACSSPHGAIRKQVFLKSAKREIVARIWKVSNNGWRHKEKFTVSFMAFEMMVAGEIVYGVRDDDCRWNSFWENVRIPCTHLLYLSSIKSNHLLKNDYSVYKHPKSHFVSTNWCYFGNHIFMSFDTHTDTHTHIYTDTHTQLVALKHNFIYLWQRTLCSILLIHKYIPYANEGKNLT